MVDIAGVAKIIVGGKLHTTMARDVKEEHGVEHHQLSVALVALHVIVERLAVGGVDVLDALPCEDAIIVEVEGEEAGATEEHPCARLHAVAAAHVIVAVYHVIIVALGASKHYHTGVDALLHTLQTALRLKPRHDAGTQAHSLGDALRHGARPVFHLL